MRKQGRKLRHLTGIALRDLTTCVQKTQSARSAKSSDDDVLAGAWKSAGKLPARTEELTSGSSSSGGGLIHAKSEMDLTRPGGRLRRRSTRGNPLGLENPLTRQKRLEDVTAGRMADVFFSLHIVGGGALVERSDDPIYISEVVSKSMVWGSATRGFLKRELMGGGFLQNPNFQFFELSHSGPHVSRLDKVTVKIWAGTQGQFRLIVELSIALSALQFIGKNVHNSSFQLFFSFLLLAAGLSPHPPHSLATGTL